ncbi:MAG: SIS domain-containing protein [Tessaracoccus sp.]|uniref:SIS domain-containing protein n=1 Tax=Tessaracoccus sp. TaxID=1971211 RepID=UPI001ED044A6|nr:SIS domain-containing protein [Tessaracoccus sp.]MBK7822683.1 SIS domain-containing protein [Tessaracoccus sp.]
MTDAEGILAAAKERIAAESAGVSAVADELDETFLTAARLLYGCRGKVFVSGSGTSGTVARRMAHLLAVSGTPAIFLPAMDALHGTLGVVTEGDIVIVISKGGGSTEINDLVTRSQDRGAGVIALTCTSGTPLTGNADLAVVVGTAPEADLGGMIAMGSTLAHGVWGDALASVLMKVRGYEWAKVHHTHPGGAVGAQTTLPKPVDRLELDPLSIDEYRAAKA